MRTGGHCRGLNGRNMRPITRLQFPTRLYGTHRLLSYYLEIGNLAEDRDSSIGIATRYELDGPEIENRWGWGVGWEFSRARPDRFRGSPGPLKNGHRVCLRGVRRPGRDFYQTYHIGPRYTSTLTSSSPLYFHYMFYSKFLPSYNDLLQ
jgi:hypothetical protein